MRMRAHGAPLILVAALLNALSATPALAQGLVSCPLGSPGTGDDAVARGFFISNYSGTTLGTVTLSYASLSAAGILYQVNLTARSGAYNGPIIGTAQRQVTMPAPGNSVATTFDFLGVPVTPGSTVTFTHSLGFGPPPLLYDVGPCAVGDAACTSCPGVTETVATTPPLDTFRRASVGVTITGVADLIFADGFEV